MQISLSNGLTLTSDMEGFNATDLISQLNELKENIITVGNAIIDKHFIYSISPEREGDFAGLAISLKNGSLVKADMEGYNAVEAAAKINKSTSLMVLIGDTIIKRDAVFFATPSEA